MWHRAASTSTRTYRMKIFNKLIYSTLVFILSLLPIVQMMASSNETERAAMEVIKRFTKNKLNVDLQASLKRDDGYSGFKTHMDNGKLYVEANNGVALCRGVYDFIKRYQAGICSWSGTRFETALLPPDEAVREVLSPFKHRYYLNVVTYGYSMPYWDKQRWDEEIDWMALHGIDMPLALVANEAISARVWKKLGLTEEEIAAYFVGPAHLPWMRMGNASGIDGPLPKEWHKKQIALQHHILKRMKTLGMKPICPAFAGFIPQAFKRLYPNLNIIETKWCGGAFRNWMLSPEEPLFHTIGKMFIEEWEKEFGTGKYYLADSFNEMEIPFPPKGSPERYKQLANYGERVYQSIKDGNEQAVWVMQGWMFGYQRDIWDYETLQALLSRVPDNGMLLLDLAEDYNHHFWHNGANWDVYKGFFNKPWIFSVIPNMGGKTAMTGQLAFYANGRLKALKSPNKGRLEGYGMAPEGIENNELIYELLTDGAWTQDSIAIDLWLENYAKCRYGVYTHELQAYFRDIQKSVYGSFTDHPRYNWQFRPGLVKKGSVNTTDDFYRAIESFAQSEQRPNNLFIADLMELTVLYAGGKLETLVKQIEDAYQKQDMVTAQTNEKAFIETMQTMDNILSAHPTLRLERWLNYARKQTNNPKQKQLYEQNARRILTIWGPPVDDYSARIWSGLLRDYYLPRWMHYFAEKRSKTPFNWAEWERDWVENNQPLSPAAKPQDIVKSCKELIQTLRHIQ